MNKNKLSRFLLSTSVGIITTLGISEVTALTPSELAVHNQTLATQATAVAAHHNAAVEYYKSKGSDDAKARTMATRLVSQSSGFAALNTLGLGNTNELLGKFKDVLIGGIELTPEHFDSFLSDISNAKTLQVLGVADVRELKSPELERKINIEDVKTVEEAKYFAEQRKNGGEFEKAADFFLKARDLTAVSNPTQRTEYAEQALLMYSEHFIHHVARVSSVTADNISKSQALLTIVKALAETTATATGFLRAASCAQELGTAIYDLVLAEKAAKAKLVATTPVTTELTAAIAASSTKIAKIYVDLYNVDIVARDMREKAADKLTGADKNAQFVAAADAYRLAIGALADAQAEKADAIFSGDVRVDTKSAEEATAFNGKYLALEGLTVTDSAATQLKAIAAQASILGAKLKGIWNARSKFASGTDRYTALTALYNAVVTSIDSALASAGVQYAALETLSVQQAGATDITAVRLVKAEQLYRVVLDTAAISPMVPANVSTAITALDTYVGANGSIGIVNGLDTVWKGLLDENKTNDIRQARINSHKALAAERAIVAKARALELEKLTAATLGDRATRLESFLTLARQADNKAAWEAGVVAADVLLADAAVSAATDGARLVKALALTAKATALLKRNTAADDILVASVDATSGALTGGILFEANTVAAAITDPARADRIRARNEVRKAFELGIELHNAAAVKQGLRTVSATVEDAYATDEVTVADAALVANVINGNSTFVSEALAVLESANTTTVAGLKAALAVLTNNTTVTGGGGAATVIDVNNYLEITVAGTRYVSKLVADVSAVGAPFTFAFEAAVAGGPVGGATVFSINVAAAPASLNALRTALAKCVTGAGQANTLAAYYNLLLAAPQDGVSLASLDTVDKVYNHLVSKFSSIRTADAVGAYKKFGYAATAWEKARKVKSDWSAEEVKNLTSATAANFAAKRDAAGVSYTAAADYETSRLRAIFAQSGRGTFADAAFDALNEFVTILAANNGRLAAFYVTEDVLNSLRNRAFSLKASASTYNAARPTPAGTTDTAVAVNDTARDAAIALAVRGGGVGAFETGVNLANAAFQGAAQYNAAAGFGTLVGERLSALSLAYRKSTTAWLPELTGSLALTATATADAHRAAIQALLQDGAAVDAGTDTAGRIFSLDARFNGGGGGNYVATHKVRRDLALAYETVLKSLKEISVSGGVTLDAHQGYVYDALVVQATRASALALTAYTAAMPTNDTQMTSIISRLTELADLSATAGAGAYGGTRSNTQSNTGSSFIDAREQAIDDMVQRINVKLAQDAADIVLNEQNAVIATADRKAQVAHELGRVFTNRGKAEAMRFANAASEAHKSEARSIYLKAVDQYKAEIGFILSVITGNGMPNRNARLIEAYDNLAEAYKYAVEFGADAGLVKERYTADYKRAHFQYREGNKTIALGLLQSLVDIAGASQVHGSILQELAAEYEAEGNFLQAAKVFKLSAINHVAQKDDAGAFSAAESALSAAKQCAHEEACTAAAEAFNAIGAQAEFLGRVKAEAYHKASEAYILGGKYADAATAYGKSADAWSKVGDHMQAGNQFEKAAWSLSKVADIQNAQRVNVIAYLAKAAHQLQIADATKRLVELADLAEAQFKVIDNTAGAVLVADLQEAVVATSDVLYEKALAFQKEGDVTYAVAAEARVIALLNKIDVKEKSARIYRNIGGLYSVQKKDAQAIDAFIKSAEHFVEANKFVDAAKSYDKAAAASLKAGQGTRIKDVILPALLEISSSIRTGGSRVATIAQAEKIEVHMAIVDVYRDLAVNHPSEVDEALAELAKIESESGVISDLVMKARIAAVKIGLLNLQAKGSRSEAVKLDLLKQSKAAFELVKGSAGSTVSSNVSIKNFITLAAKEFADMYMHVKPFHMSEASLAGKTALSYLDDFKSVVEVTEAAAKAAFDSASEIKTAYDVALEASARAADVMETYAKASAEYIINQQTKARVIDMVYLRGMPDRMVNVVKQAVSSTLLGILKSREEAAVMQANFVNVMNATNKINSVIVAVRKHEASNDSHGDATKVEDLTRNVNEAPVAMKNVMSSVETEAKAAHAKVNPVERAKAEKELVVAKTSAIADAVVNGVKAHAELVKQAPAAVLTSSTFTDSSEKIVSAIVGDTKGKGVIGDLQDAQTGPTAATHVAINVR